MKTGIIISTQSPVSEGDFPRSGGTAYALNSVIHFPIVKMHRDAKARDEEKISFNTLSDGSFIFISAHGDKGSQTLSGEYKHPDDDNKTTNHSTFRDWKLSDYRDLILDNSSKLEKGHKLTIILWACYSGSFNFNSSAAHLARLFYQRGILTQIIAPNSVIHRFDGKYSQFEKDKSCLKYRVGSPNILIYDINEKGSLTISQNEKELYFSKAGMIGLSKKTLFTEQMPNSVKELMGSLYYKPLCTKSSDRREHLKGTNEFIITPSSQYVNNYHILTASYLMGNKNQVRSVRYVISKDGKYIITPIRNKKNERLTVGSQKLIDIIKDNILDWKKTSNTYNKNLPNLTLFKSKEETEKNLDKDTELKQDKVNKN